MCIVPISLKVQSLSHVHWHEILATVMIMITPCYTQPEKETLNGMLIVRLSTEAVPLPRLDKRGPNLAAHGRRAAFQVNIY